MLNVQSVEQRTLSCCRRAYSDGRFGVNNIRADASVPSIHNITTAALKVSSCSYVACTVGVVDVGQIIIEWIPKHEYVSKRCKNLSSSI